MARKLRVVIPGVSLHVVARGVGGKCLFHEPSDYDKYLERLQFYAAEEKVEVHAVCLMPNHIHLLLTATDDRLAVARLMKRQHTWFAGFYNKTHNATGHVFESRYYSSPLDAAHFFAAMRYIELNPVRSGLCDRPEQWRFSSARAHCSDNSSFPVELSDSAWKRRFDPLRWRQFLKVEDPEKDRALRRVIKTGRALGRRGWLRVQEQRLGRSLEWPQRHKPPARDVPLPVALAAG